MGGTGTDESFDVKREKDDNSIKPRKTSDSIFYFYTHLSYEPSLIRLAISWLPDSRRLRKYQLKTPNPTRFAFHPGLAIYVAKGCIKSATRYTNEVKTIDKCVVSSIRE